MESERSPLRLKSIALKGFKSIDGVEGIHVPLKDVTVLLGANGAGKSNILSFFDMLQALSDHKLRDYIGRYGIDRLLYYGAKNTESIDCTLFFEDSEKTMYSFSLPCNLSDIPYFSQEKIKISSASHGTSQGGKNIYSEEYQLHGQNGESGLSSETEGAGKRIREYLTRLRRYQFHDTAEFSKVRGRCYTDDAYFLRSDASNLAAFLHMLKNTPEFLTYYNKIIFYVRQIMPQFDDFSLDPLPMSKDYVRLNWIDKTGALFDPHQISDGALRFIALATLLLQPAELMPSLILLEEPELGLHPAALAFLATMFPIAAQHSQIVLATHSSNLVTEFEPEQILIVEWDKYEHRTKVHELDIAALRDWLDEECLSQLWEKNFFGGRP